MTIASSNRLFPLPLPLPPTHPRCSSRRRHQRYHVHAAVHRLAASVLSALNTLFSVNNTNVFSASSHVSCRGEPSRTRPCNYYDQPNMSASQSRIVTRVYGLCRRFVIESRPSLEESGSDLSFDFLANYQKLAARAVPIVADRVALPSSAPAADMLSLLPPSLSSFYSSPSSVISSSLLPPASPRPHVMGSHAQYVSLLRRMNSVGLLSFTTRPRAINGLFAVPKPDSDQLRLIVDARAANACFKEPQSVYLPSPELLARLVVPADRPWFVGKSDLSNFYHCLRLPSWLVPFFALPPVSSSELGLPASSSSAVIYPCCVSVPMGWSHAVFIAQAIHEHLLRSLTCIADSSFLTSTSDLGLNRLRVLVYIDDIAWLDVNQDRVRAALQEYGDRVRAVGLVLNPNKIVPPQCARLRVLGFDVDPQRNTVAMSACQLSSLVDCTQQLLRAPRVSGKRLQEVLGKWVWSMLICRPALSVFSASFTFAQRFQRTSRPLWRSVRSELQLACALAPVLVASVSSLASSRLVCTDASLTGGAVLSALAPPHIVRSVLASPLALVSSTSSSVSSTPVTVTCASRSSEVHASEFQCVSEPSSAAASTPYFAPERSSAPPRVSPPTSSLRSTPAACAPVCGSSVPLVPSVYGLSSRLQSSLFRLRWRRMFQYQWVAIQHINVLEMHSVLSALRWLVTFPSSIDSTTVLLSDSAVVCGALAKGRSSSFALLRLLKRVAAVTLATGIVLRPLWVRSADNPADYFSRHF